MKNKVCIIIPYFGKFPNTINAFLSSCSKNSEFNWLIFSDNKVINSAPNVTFIYCTFEEIKNRIESKIGFKVALDSPYKLCDYRPAYGHIFEDYLEEYDFWGYGDIDLVYGNISTFITDEILEKYDKVYPCGHLSLVRNKVEFNMAYCKNVSYSYDYRQVFANNKSFIFDEYRGLNEKILALGGRIYGKIDFADIDIIYKRFRTADHKTIGVIFPRFPFMKDIPKNYKEQLFSYENGHTYRIFIDNKKRICKQEIVYIHYRRKIPCEIRVEETVDYYVTAQGFIAKNKEISYVDIEANNPYLGMGVEMKEYLYFLKNHCIYILGRNKQLRSFIRFLKGKRVNE